MKRLVLALVAPLALVCSSRSALATPYKQAVPHFIDAAPDQETLHEMLAPASKATDADEAKEEAEQRLARIADLDAAYKASGNEIQKAEMIYELSNLHAEHALYLRDKAVRQYLADYDKWWIGETLQEPELKLDAWKEQLLKLVNVQRDMVANYEKYPRIAEASWMLASTMARLGNDHCERYFKQAIQLSKTPEWATKAKLSRADWLVATNKPDEAVALYTEVREGKQTADDLKAYATYRLGWVHLQKAWKQPEKDRGPLLKKATAALELAYLGAKSDVPHRFDLRREAAEDLAWLWATTGNEKEALAFFEKNENPEAAAVFRERQADERLAKGQLAEGVAYYRARIAAEPLSPKRPDWHLKLAHAFIVAGHVAGLQGETWWLAKLSGNENDPWYDEFEGDEVVMGRAKRMHTLLPLAAGFQLYRAAAGEKDEKKKKALLGGTAHELETYMAKQKDDAQALTIRLTLVDVLVTLEKYEDALKHLDAIVKMGKKAGDSLVPAAQERLRIIAALDEKQQYPAVPAPGEAKAPITLPPLKARFATAADEFLKLNPEAEIAPNLRYQIAADLFTYGHYDKALPLFEQLATDFPRTEQAKIAIETVLSMNLKRKNWEELVRLSTAFLNNRNVKGKALRDYIKENLDWAKAQQATGH